MQYLTYAEYQSIGGTLDLTAFNHYIIRASSLISAETHNRIEAMENTPNEVKALCRDLIEYFVANKTGETVQSRSQSVGNVSESVTFGAKTEENISAEIENLFREYLLSITDDNGTPLLYRGCLK